MATTEFVTGVQVFVVGTDAGDGQVVTDDLHIRHAVPSAEAGTEQPRAMCGIFVDQVLLGVPFPPAQTLATSREVCAECLRLVTGTGPSDQGSVG